MKPLVRRAAGLVVLLVSAGFASAGIEPSRLPPAQIPTPILSSLRTAKRGTLYRVTGEFNNDWEAHKNARKIDGYPAFATAVVPRAVMDEITRVLSDSRSYLADGAEWTCLPHPIYLLRFHGDFAVIDGCGPVDISITVNGKTQTWSHGLNLEGEARVRKLLGRILPPPANCCD